MLTGAGNAPLTLLAEDVVQVTTCGRLIFVSLISLFMVVIEDTVTGGEVMILVLDPCCNADSYRLFRIPGQLRHELKIPC